jgi:hypothetical protein
VETVVGQTLVDQRVLRDSNRAATAPQHAQPNDLADVSRRQCPDPPNNAPPSPNPGHTPSTPNPTPTSARPTSAHWDEHHHPSTTDHNQVVGVEQCWPGDISGRRRCSGRSGAGRGKPTRDAPYDAPQLSPLDRPRETRAILNGIDADGIRFATSIRETVSGNRRFGSEVAAMTAKGSRAHHHLFDHRIPAPARRGRPRNPASMRLKRIRHQQTGCGGRGHHRSSGTGCRFPWKEPGHDASR